MGFLMPSPPKISAPPPPPPLPPAAATPANTPASAATLANSSVQQTGAAARSRAAIAGASQSGTVGAAGIQGLKEPLSTSKATLLGSTSAT